ncbi:MAG TPA: hypothetical protein VNK52_01555 [Hyphomicrobiaceae bacterium]|nr:hypothetical protein [Hyphomicrobiaceae bacterium]
MSQPAHEVMEAPPAEILPPSEKLERFAPVEPTHSSHDLTDGALEHAFLRHRVDKYEDRALWAGFAFLIASALAVAVKAGLPIDTERFFLPRLTNERLIAGMLGSSSAILAMVFCYYGLRIQQHRVHAELRLIRRSLSGFVADCLKWFGILLSVPMLALVIYLTFWDVILLIDYVWVCTNNVCRGWDPVSRFQSNKLASRRLMLSAM